jgi:Zn-dependent protease
MFTSRWQFFRLLGIPVSVDASWLAIFALVTWSLANQFHGRVPGLAPWAYWIMGLATGLAFFVCIVLHEFGHAIAARAFGMPIRGITLFLFGGVAELGGEPPSARCELVVAIAGPIVSAILSAIFGALSIAGEGVGWPSSVTVCFLFLAGINLTVLLFNLVPAFPLDGGRVLRAILWGATANLRRATYWASLAGQGFAWIFIAIGLLLIFWNDFVSGLWWGLIGWFLNNVARTSYQQVLIRQTLEGEPLRRFMNPNPIVVPSSLDLQHWVDDFVYRYHRKVFPVASNGHLEGVITTRALSRVPREEWPRHTVAEVMRHDLKALSVSPDADTFKILEQMQRTGSSRLLVTEGDRLVGIVSLKDLLGFLRLKLELESPEVEKL